MQLTLTGIAVLVSVAFFGYMLALLQWRVRAMFSSPDVSYTIYMVIIFHSMISHHDRPNIFLGLKKILK